MVPGWWITWMCLDRDRKSLVVDNGQMLFREIAMFAHEVYGYTQ
jgi:hypothetical protein